LSAGGDVQPQDGVPPPGEAVFPPGAEVAGEMVFPLGGWEALPPPHVERMQTGALTFTGAVPLTAGEAFTVPPWTLPSE
jgi:hypothetical protein